MRERTSDAGISPKDRMERLVDQSLVGLMYLTILAVSILLFRIYQYGSSSLSMWQLILCCVFFASLSARRKIPQNILLGGVLVCLLVLTAIALVRFGLVTPALVIMTIIPVIVGSVRGMQQGLFVSACMVVLIVAAGVLYSIGLLQPSYNLQDYMQQPINWVLYALAYCAMVFWGTAIAARVTEYWRESLHNLKVAEEDALREREFVAKLQRQQSIVELSGGVAHDFNNVLAAITFNIELAKEIRADQGQADPVIDEALQDALDATERGAGLTRNLLAFANVAALEPVKLDVNLFIENSISWMARTIPENIDIETDLSADLRQIIADDPSLSSALLNLIINARDAMPDGGHLFIKTQNIEVGRNNDDAHMKSLTPGHYVELTVSDTGVGISASDQERIFDPFFTTKGLSEGSGLGLAMVYGFMKQSGGSVGVRSEPGKGATFQLLFRAYDDPDNESNPPVRTQQNATPSGAKLMIVEDEAAILNSLSTILYELGYKVRTATSGDQAWEALSRDSSVDLVLSDVVMPGEMQGTDLAREIQNSLTGVPVILMSGNTFSSRDELNLPVVWQLMNKPVRKADLIDAIEGALDKFRSQ